MGYYTNMLTNCAVLKTVNGTDSNGVPNIIAQDIIDCKIEFKNSLVTGAQGQELASSGRLYCESVVKVDDLITIENKEYKVVNVNPYYPLSHNDGALCVINEVYFG